LCFFGFFLAHFFVSLRANVGIDFHLHPLHASSESKRIRQLTSAITLRLLLLRGANWPEFTDLPICFPIAAHDRHIDLRGKLNALNLQFSLYARRARIMDRFFGIILPRCIEFARFSRLRGEI
jgi:hypothetical protein